MRLPLDELPWRLPLDELPPLPELGVCWAVLAMCFKALHSSMLCVALG